MNAPPHPEGLPTIAQLRTHSLTAVVQHEIERMILSGELPAGAHLNENALAAQLSVSRGPVREACRALAALGFVDRIPNRGAFVRTLERADAVEVYDLRAGLTALAASLVAPIAGDRLLRTLHGHLQKMEWAAEDGDFEAFYPLNLEFHEAIVAATGNARLIRHYGALVKEFHLFRKHGVAEPGALVAANREHAAIVAALEKRDSRESYEASFRHVANGKARMLAVLDSMAGGDAVDAAPHGSGTVPAWSPVTDKTR